MAQLTHSVESTRPIIFMPSLMRLSFSSTISFTMRVTGHRNTTVNSSPRNVPTVSAKSSSMYGGVGMGVRSRLREGKVEEEPRAVMRV